MIQNEDETRPCALEILMITRYQPKFIIFRKPCLMEDEGQYHILASCDTREDVAVFCKEFTEDGKGYFHMGDLLWDGSNSVGCFVPEELQNWMPERLCDFIRRL